MKRLSILFLSVLTLTAGLTVVAQNQQAEQHSQEIARHQQVGGCGDHPAEGDDEQGFHMNRGTSQLPIAGSTTSKR